MTLDVGAEVSKEPRTHNPNRAICGRQRRCPKESVNDYRPRQDIAGNLAAATHSPTPAGAAKTQAAGSAGLRLAGCGHTPATKRQRVAGPGRGPARMQDGERRPGRQQCHVHPPSPPPAFSERPAQQHAIDKRIMIGSETATSLEPSANSVAATVTAPQE